MRAAATAVPATMPSGVSAAPSASTSGFGEPSNDGPREENGAGAGAAGRSRGAPTFTRPNVTFAPAFPFSAAFAAAPVSPTTGAATRPEGIIGSGRSRGSARMTARAPAPAAAVACATGLSPARTSATRPATLGRPRRSAAVSVLVTGPASFPRRRPAAEGGGAGELAAADGDRRRAGRPRRPRWRRR